MADIKNFVIPPFYKEMLVKALKQGGISLVEDIAAQLQTEEIETLIQGLQKARTKKTSTIDIKPVGG